ncbi:MAG: hypothetical protein EXS00_00720 [Phycisphaerales bacterium]|nr:hypothetical protein [Phycisphaerales bacterium]
MTSVDTIVHDPKVAAQCFAKAKSLLGDGLRSEAIVELRKSVEAEGSTEQMFQLAYLLDLEGEENEAIELYECLCRLPKPPVNALINLAVLLEDRNQSQNAERCLTKVLETNAVHGRARLFFKDAQASRNMMFDEAEARDQAKRDAMLDTPVTDFELSVRARNCLKKMQIRTLGDLLKISEAELLAYKNFGETSLVEIKSMLQDKGLRLGQGVDGGSYTAKRPEHYQELVDKHGAESLNRSVAALNLSVRARKALQLLNINTVGDLASVTEAELMGVKNFGATSLEEIKINMADAGLSLRTLD